MALRLGRLDHIVLQVPDIASAHARLLALGFEEAWPIGWTWSVGPTCGVALGGINLELSQPDEDPPERPGLAELVFEPAPGISLAEYGRVMEKIEADPAKLAARGFPPEMRSEPQRICTNAFPVSVTWPWFVCDYAPILRARLGPEAFPAPFGAVARVGVGALEVRPRFAPVEGRTDLGAFLHETESVSTPIIKAGEGPLIEFHGGNMLDLVGLALVEDPMNGG